MLWRKILRTVMLKYRYLKWLRQRKLEMIICALLTLIIVLYCISEDEIILDAEFARQQVERNLMEALKQEQGIACRIPILDPFDKKVMKFHGKTPTISCPGFDWVKCYLSQCRVRKEILDQYDNVNCKYQEIIFLTDFESILGKETRKRNQQVYDLVESDHVSIECTGKVKDRVQRRLPTSWSGLGLGIRHIPYAAQNKSEKDINVLFVCFDSTSKNGFIRRMPKSYKVLTEEMEAVVLNGYNIVGDGTPAALFPIFTGRSMLDLPDARKTLSQITLDSFPFIFYRFRKRGYCVGDTLSYQILLNATEQFFTLQEKKFMFTFIADITHDDFNVISIADIYFSEWLKRFKGNGHMENTLLFVMGDHGHRFDKRLRDTLIGKLEERLPLMAIILPNKLKSAQPNILRALQQNADKLTTPYDIHATLLDLFNIEESTERPERALSLFKKISSLRTCAEAGIQKHWCTCLRWSELPSSDPMHKKVGLAFADYINKLTEPHRDLCAQRSVSIIRYIQRQTLDEQLLKFHQSKDGDGYIPKFNKHVVEVEREDYNMKIILNPGEAIYEATAVYVHSQDVFEFEEQSISRINAYHNEPHCISSLYPHLNKYCYCLK